MIIYLIRHAEYPPEEDKSHAENMGISLTPFGKTQAGALGEFLKGRGVEAVYTSSLMRARETAEVIASICAVNLNVDERLNEFVVTLGEKRPEAIKSLKKRIALDHEFASLDGESVNQAVSRFIQALDALAASGKGRVAVVSHERILQWTLVKLFSLAAPPPLRHASLTTLFYENGVFRLGKVNRSVWTARIFLEKAKRRLRRAGPGRP